MVMRLLPSKTVRSPCCDCSSVCVLLLSSALPLAATGVGRVIVLDDRS